MPTEFNDQIKQFAARVEQIHSSIQTEEATKMSMIIPFFQLLGYDVFNPSELLLMSASKKEKRLIMPF